MVTFYDPVPHVPPHPPGQNNFELYLNIPLSIYKYGLGLRNWEGASSKSKHCIKN